MALLIAWFVAYNCEPLIASVEVEVTRPAATLVIVRTTPLPPTLTVLVAFVPANVYVLPPITVVGVFVTAPVTEFAPNAMSFLLFATAPVPMANVLSDQISSVARNAYSGVAAASALAMIPDVDLGKTIAVGVGTANYKGYQATALGASVRITQNVKMKIGAGYSAAGTTVGAGASYQW
jgi:hypothetical protein